MIERTIARRYAASLLAVTDPAGQTEAAEAMLLALKDAFKGDRAVRDLLVNPRVPRRIKTQLLAKALQGAPPALHSFLKLLVDKDRIALLPHVADAFDELADRSAGVVRVEVLSFQPLSEAHRASLETKAARLARGRKIKMDVSVDPELAGGLWIRIGDSLVDGSVRTRLKRIREKLTELRAV